MDVLQHDSKGLDELSDSGSGSCRTSIMKGNMGASQDFEKIEGALNNTQTESSQNLSSDIRREETVFEKVKNFGTNLKFNLGGLGQSFALYQQPKPSKKIYLLGNEYEIDDDDGFNIEKQRLQKDFNSIIWFSYRKNFPKLVHKDLPANESYVSDTGWGCMIRACQMAFARVLKQIKKQKYKANEDDVNKQIVEWFLDNEINPKKAPYSIQAISNYMYKEYNLKPGTWFKASNVLLTLEALHAEYGVNTVSEIKMLTFIEGTVYINKVLERMVDPEEDKISKDVEDFEAIEEDNDNPNEVQQKKKRDSALFPYTLTETATEETINDMERMLELRWKEKSLITVLAKIGLEKPNPEYIPFIKSLMEFDEFVGMIGGKPGLAFYIVGYDEDKAIYLDPHFVQESISKNKIKENMSSYFCNQMRYVKFTDIDTSVAFMFMINNDDQKGFKNFIKKFHQNCQRSDSFLGMEISPPNDEDIEDFESVDEENNNGNGDDFEMISGKKI